MDFLDNFEYQIVIIGDDRNNAHKRLTDRLNTSFDELNTSLKRRIVFYNSNGNPAELKDDCPAVGVYFEEADTNKNRQALAFLSRLQSNAKVIVPVYYSEEYNTVMPPILKKINGLKVAESIANKDIDAIANICLEALNLTRKSRRLFISYYRDESSDAAHQLFEHFTNSGFEVFLDVVSIPIAIPDFQNELMHRLSNADIGIILDTPSIMTRPYVQVEIEQAHLMGISMLQIVWPGKAINIKSSLIWPFELEEDNFHDFDNLSNSNKRLTEDTLNKVVGKVESLRASAFASRWNFLVNNFKQALDDTGHKVFVQINRNIHVSTSTNKSVIAVPIIGVPESKNFHEAHEYYSTTPTAIIFDKAWLLYNDLNISNDWQKHLKWLDVYLPIDAVSIKQAPEKLGEL